MDKHWLDVIDHLRTEFPRGLGVAAHEDFRAILSSVVPYSEIRSYEPEFFHGLVIHKGLYEQIEPFFLQEFLSRAKPTFANEVFIVLRTDGTALKLRNIHLGTLREIAQWAARQTGTESAELRLCADAVLGGMAKFIVQNLAKPLDPTRPASSIAIAETAERINDTAWFWADDSGKTAELFAVPRLRDAYPELADATLDYVLRLSPERIIQRRSAVPELRLLDGRPESFKAYNSFFHLTGNLKLGRVCPSIRFNDDRTRFLGEYSGNALRFRYRGRRQVVDVEDAITHCSIDEQPERIIFSHTSAIEGRPLIGRRRPVCNLTYRYSLWKARPAVEVEAEITTLPGITLQDVHLSTALDQLSSGGGFDSVVIGVGGQYERHAPRGEPATRLHVGAADYLGISETVVPGFAHGFHMRFRNGNELGDITAEGSRSGRFHWIYSRYSLGRIEPQQTRSISEDRLLTGGGYYREPDIYRRVLEGTTTNGNIDPSMSYDIGAELNAVAVTLLFSKQGRYRSAPAPERLDALKEWYDRHLGIYVEAHRPDKPGAGAPVFIRGLSFVILSLDCMIRAFGSEPYGALLSSCVSLLLRLQFEVEGGRGETVFSVPQSPELDCHCSALLALARAAVYGDPGNRISQAIHRALQGTLILHASAEQYGQPGLSFQSLWIRSHAGVPPQDGGFWVFKLGLALRAFNAIRQVHAAGLLSLDGTTLAYLNELTDVARSGLFTALRREGETIEVLTSARSGETNSETQPWAALGLVPAVEWELYGRPPETDLELSAPAEPAATSHAPASGGRFDRAAPPLQVDWQCTGTTLERLSARVAASWAELGETKPHWSVLSHDEYLPSRIAGSEEEFFASGRVDRDWLVATLARAGRKPGDFTTVLEYGCGLGRVTNHLAECFTRVIARDISGPHLGHARARSAEIGLTNIDYGLALPPDFGMAQPFDLWFSFIVLQHNPPPIMAAILRLALKWLVPRGLAVFQIPTYARQYRFEIDSYLESAPTPGAFELHCLPQSAVFAIAHEADCRIREVFEDSSIGEPDWVSNVIVLEK
jgi:SAM-dependent methyltransferase